jgi:hypothetical protein
VDRALEFYRKGGFTYSLQPGAYGPNVLEEFLFERKTGFCEHFAASFGTLMRAAKIPCRLVIGYLGGELYGTYYIVHQYNAHVWAEVYLPETGWTRIDPTAALAPSRLASDFRTLMADNFNLGFTVPRDAWWGQTVLAIRQYWDNLNYAWFTRVVQFNEEEQFVFFSLLGLADIVKACLATLATLLLVTGLIWWWIRRPAQHPDPAVRVWQRVCAALARKGLARGPAEPPLAYATRCSPSVPGLTNLALLYIDHRYGTRPAVLAALKSAAAEVHKSLSHLRS